MQKKIIKYLLLLIVLLVGHINLTYSYLTNQSTITNSHISTGWWAKPTVTVISPNGGEMWTVGSTHDIIWTATANGSGVTITGVDILISTDGGSTYPTTLAAGLPNTGNYSWTISDPKSATMKIKVVATDSHGLTGMDESDNIFDPSDAPVCLQPTGPSLEFNLNSDKKAASFRVKDINDYKTLDYELTYKAYDVEKGVVGTGVVITNTDNYSKEIDLATCSAGVCTYDQNVHDFKLSVTLTDQNGHTINLEQTLP